MKIPKGAIRWLSIGLGGALLFLSLWFLVSQLLYGWKQISARSWSFRWSAFACGIVAILLAFLCNTIIWHRAVLPYSAKRRPKLSEAVAVVNTSQLTKYLPGKVWSWVIQVLMTKSFGISAGKVLGLNLYLALSVTLQQAVFGGLLLTIRPGIMSMPLSWILFLVAVLSYFAFLFFGSFASKLLNEVLAKRGHANAVFPELSAELVVLIQLGSFTVVCLLGIGAVFGAVTLGVRLDVQVFLLVFLAMNVADMIGFVALVVPGGIGLREAILVLLFRGSFDESIALVLPILLRVMGVIVDALLGGFGLLLLGRMRKNLFSSSEP